MSNKTILQNHNEIISDNNISIDELINKINNLPEAGSGEPTLQEKTITPTTSNQIIEPDENYDGLSKVTVNGVTSAIDSDIKAINIRKGIDILGVTGSLEEGITPSGTKSITANGDYDITEYANASVNVPIPDGYIKPSGNINITNTNSVNVTNYATAQVVDSDLVASNIKSGVNILGVTGTLEANEDLSSELSTQNNLITTQETTIDSIISALEGKASGGSGGNVETCTITMKHYPTYSTNFAIQRVAYQTLDDSGNITTEDISYSNGDISYSTNEFILSNVVCPSIMYVSSGGMAILSGGSKIYSYPSTYTHVIKVDETGTFEFQPTG